MARKVGWEYRQELEKVLDKRDAFFEKLKGWETKLGFVPKKYSDDKPLMDQYEDYKKNGSWRKNKKLLKKITRRFKSEKRNR